jgi:hypothetical protein
VCGFRHHHEIAAYRDGEWVDRGEITLDALAKIVGICNMTALRMLRRGDIKGRQACPGAPSAIKAADLTGFAGRKGSDPPATSRLTGSTASYRQKGLTIAKNRHLVPGISERTQASRFLAACWTWLWAARWAGAYRFFA